MRFPGALLFICVLLVTCGARIPVGVEAAPMIWLSSGTANVGSAISVNGNGFLPTDTTCSFSSPSSGVVTFAACVIRSGALSGGFSVGNVLPGGYVIQATGNQGDFAQVLLQVNAGVQISLSPSSGPPGIQVLVQGTGFLPSDNTCEISSPSIPNPILTGTTACAIQSGSGIPHAGFTIGNVLPGQYVIQLSGSQGDDAQAILAVD